MLSDVDKFGYLRALASRCRDCNNTTNLEDLEDPHLTPESPVNFDWDIPFFIENEKVAWECVNKTKELKPTPGTGSWVDQIQLIAEQASYFRELAELENSIRELTREELEE